MKKLDSTLIIGIGNNTRQDDGLGWCFLDNLQKEGFPEGHLVYKYQLMVEDAELIYRYKTVYFIDAHKTPLKDGFSIERVYPSEKVTFSTHSVPPTQILNLCETLYNEKPSAFVIKIEGCNWDFKIGLSESAEQNLKKSLTHFKAFIK